MADISTALSVCGNKRKRREGRGRGALVSSVKVSTSRIFNTNIGNMLRLARRGE